MFACRTPCVAQSGQRACRTASRDGPTNRPVEHGGRIAFQGDGVSIWSSLESVTDADGRDIDVATTVMLPDSPDGMGVRICATTAGDDEFRFTLEGVRALHSALTVCIDACDQRLARERAR